jgi:hypothetical protein
MAVKKVTGGKVENKVLLTLKPVILKTLKLFQTRQTLNFEQFKSIRLSSFSVIVVFVLLISRERD